MLLLLLTACAAKLLSCFLVSLFSCLLVFLFSCLPHFSLFTFHFSLIFTKTLKTLLGIFSTLCFRSALAVIMVVSKLPPSSSRQQNIFFRILNLPRRKTPLRQKTFFVSSNSSCVSMKLFLGFSFVQVLISQRLMVWMQAFVWELVHKEKHAATTSETQSSTYPKGFSLFLFIFIYIIVCSLQSI